MTLRPGRVGVIGGLALRALPGLAVSEEVRLDTPWGEPSDLFRVGTLSDVPVALLVRHGPGHRIPPQALNHRANVWGFKKLGCDALLSVSDGESLQERCRPGDLLVPDQFLDLSGAGRGSFFDEAGVAHVSMARPFCPELAAVLSAAGRGAGAEVHPAGTILSAGGPQHATRAESLLYRSWGADASVRAAAAEAKLCREAEICYATAVLVNAFDSWSEAEAPSPASEIALLKKNARTAMDLLAEAVKRVDASRSCRCRSALAGALVTLPADVPAPVRERLALLTEKYWK